MKFIEQFNKNDFEIFFTLHLNNPKSLYFSEIEEHWNSHDLLVNKPLLNSIIKTHLNKSIDFEILNIFTDYTSHFIQNKCRKQEIYNQKPYHSTISKNEGFDLQLYYHICFIGLLYSTAINNKVDISTNMNTIYSSMVKKIIENIKTNNDDDYPTNYHWLINEVFDLQSNWLHTFNDIEYFDRESSYVNFIPNSLSFCLAELYEGMQNDKISISFLNKIIYHHILKHYFSTDLNLELITSIEEKIFDEKFKEYKEMILNFALKERFAIDYQAFVNGDFQIMSKKEKEMLNRMRNLL